MSLVNDMLQDLQNRQAEHARPVQGLRPVQQATTAECERSQSDAARFHAIRMVGVAVVVVVTAIAATEWLRQQLRTEANPAHARSTPVSTTDAATTNPITANPATGDTAENEKTPNITDEPVATLASLTRYRMDYSLERPVASVRKRVVPVAAPAVARHPRRVPQKEAQASSEPSVIESTAGEALTSASSANPVLSKVPRNPADHLRQKGLRALRAHKPVLAEEIFRKLVRIDPADTDAHLLHYGALVQQSQPVAAADVLRAGLQQADNPARIAIVLAHLLISEQQLEQARQLLERYRDLRAENLEYEATLAAVYERSQHYELAAERYRWLLERVPSNGAWWIGLGIASEAMGDFVTARDAYSRSQDKQIEQELRRYASQRLARLESR